MRFRILDGVRVTDDDGNEVPLQPQEQHAVFRLVVADGQLVPAETLETVLVHKDAGNPRQAVSKLMSRLAKKINCPDTDDNDKRLVGKGQGDFLRYGLLPKRGDYVDVRVWRGIRDRADEVFSESPQQAALMLERGLRLWSDPPLVGLPSTMEDQRKSLLDEHLNALAQLAEAQLWLKRHHRLTTWLPAVVRANPWREDLLALLMKALYHTGNPSEARKLYLDLRQRLKTEIGPDATPMPMLANIYRQIGRHDPGLLVDPVPVLESDEAVKASGGDLTAVSFPRMINYAAGGKYHGPADRAAVEAIDAAAPDVTELSRQNELWGKRVARRLAGEGIRQFIEIGAGIPSRHSVHNAVRVLLPDAVVAYMTPDPAVVRHGNRLLRGERAAAFALGDLREPQSILENPVLEDLGIDLTEPVLLLSPTAVNYVPREEDAAGLLRCVTGGLAEGSQVAVNVATYEGVTDEVMALFGSLLAGTRPELVMRSKAEAAEILDGNGLRLRDPITDVAAYWPDRPVPPPGEFRAYVGVSEVVR